MARPMPPVLVRDEPFSPRELAGRDVSLETSGKSWQLVVYGRFAGHFVLHAGSSALVRDGDFVTYGGILSV